MLPKIIRTGIHRYEGTGVRKAEMATQYRKAYVPVTLDVDKDAVMKALQDIYWESKARNVEKYTPKKYKKTGTDAEE